MIDMAMVNAVTESFGGGCRIFVSDGPSNGFHVTASFEEVVAYWEAAHSNPSGDD